MILISPTKSNLTNKINVPTWVVTYFTFTFHGSHYSWIVHTNEIIYILPSNLNYNLLFTDSGLWIRRSVLPCSSHNLKNLNTSNMTRLLGGLEELDGVRVFCKFGFDPSTRHQGLNGNRIDYLRYFLKQQLFTAMRSEIISPFLIPIFYWIFNFPDSSRNRASTFALLQPLSSVSSRIFL